MTLALDEAALQAVKEAGKFADIRQLQDGTVVAIGQLLYTVAVYIDVDLLGWRKRFCYDDAQLALAEYKSLHTGQDEPSSWIARRPHL